MALSTVERLAQAMADLLAEVAATRAPASGADQGVAPVSWRERLWTAPGDTRLGIAELSEALGRSKAFIYRHTRAKSIPHRLLDGHLTFRAADIREWLQDRENLIVTPGLRTLVTRKAPLSSRHI